MDDKILESDFFERSAPPCCCELLAILFADVTDGMEEVTELRGPGSGSARNRSTITRQSVTYETK
ncbi:MAG: hypothetical protein P8182_08160 [Deltaproteobacteria bacterium]